MWFKLATADFKDKNLGKMADIAGSWGVTYTLQGNISKDNCPTTVKMNDGKTQAAADFTATFTLGEGATLTSITAKLKSSGTQLIQVTSGTSITIPAASITGDIEIIAIATSSSTGGGDTPVTPTNYTFTINPDPDTATVTLSATGYSTVSGTGSKSITVANGTTVNWSVSADGYTTRTGNWTISGGNETESVVLTATDSVINIADSGAVFSGMGYTLDSSTYKKTERESYFVYEYIPVQPNTTYVSSDGAGRIWLLNSNKEQITTLNIWSGTPKYTFTTTNETAYVSISYCANAALGYGEADPATASLTVYTPNETPEQSTVITLANSSAELHDGYNLNSSTGDLTEKTGYFTYQYIPVEPSTTYLSTIGGTRTWFYDSSKAKLSTENIKNNAVPYQFTTPSNASYVSIAYQADGGIEPVPVASTVTLTKVV